MKISRLLGPSTEYHTLCCWCYLISIASYWSVKTTNRWLVQASVLWRFSPETLMMSLGIHWPGVFQNLPSKVKEKKLCLASPTTMKGAKNLLLSFGGYIFQAKVWCSGWYTGWQGRTQVSCEKHEACSLWQTPMGESQCKHWHSGVSSSQLQHWKLDHEALKDHMPGIAHDKLHYISSFIIWTQYWSA